MGLVLIFLGTILGSFVGISVKAASAMVDSTTVTFARFALGVVSLVILMLWTGQPFKIESRMRWVWIGAIGKSFNYFFENLAISIGYSYGNILVGPLQTLVLLFIAAYWFKEKISARGWLAAFLCICGVLLIGWNGLPLKLLIQGNAVTTLLFALAAVGSAFHFLSQKMLIQTMSPGNMNLSVFFWCAVITVIPLPVTSSFSGHWSLAGVAALVMLGFITGISFYWFAKGLQKVNFVVAVIVNNTAVLFTILWAWLVFDEPITRYIIAGAVTFLLGIVILNVPLKAKRIS